MDRENELPFHEGRLDEYYVIDETTEGGTPEQWHSEFAGSCCGSPACVSLKDLRYRD